MRVLVKARLSVVPLHVLPACATATQGPRALLAVCRPGMHPTEQLQQLQGGGVSFSARLPMWVHNVVCKLCSRVCSHVWCALTGALWAQLV